MAMAVGLHQLLLSPTTYYTTTPPAAAASPCRRRRRRLLSTPAWSHRSGPTSTVAAAASRTSEQSSSTRRKQQQVTLKLTYLEINSWVWEVHQQHQAAPLRILVDPLVVGNLDFGMPWLYDGAKKNPKVKALGVDDLLAPDARPDLLIITNRLDDHCHVRTLTQLSARAPDLPVVTTPNARAVLASLPTPFRHVTYLEPGESTAVSPDVRVLATAGTLLGPPWERPENGYVLLMPAGADADDRNGLLYYEPHCLHDRSFLERKRVRADVVITPVVKQLLPLPLPGNYYTLVSGQEDAVDLAGMLRARYVVPMSNADLDAGGLLTTVLTEQGTTQSFQALLSEALPQVQVLDPTPGVPLHLDLELH
ncbi:uncharacterized protein [Miscanthus floridulus]|uniref:uncharacterized protein n=1 Tax=Miscanthus floridulus TaxID=154761 RepID=UPI003457C5E8